MPSFRIVLVHSRNALNMGAAARAMANFGLDDLVAVAPYVEAWHTARSARAGAGVLARARSVETLREAVEDCSFVVGTTDGQSRTPEVPLAPWPGVAAALVARPPAERVAVIFGSEKFGLGLDDISFCHCLARIPTQPGAPSMNLGQAVAVCVYELLRARQELEAREGGTATGSAATAAGIDAAGRERLLGAWYPILERVGVVRPEHRARETRVLREMLNRWPLRPRDQHRLMGLARQLRHALEGTLKRSDPWPRPPAPGDRA